MSDIQTETPVEVKPSTPSPSESLPPRENKRFANKKDSKSSSTADASQSKTDETLTSNIEVSSSTSAKNAAPKETKEVIKKETKSKDTKEAKETRAPKDKEKSESKENSKSGANGTAPAKKTTAADDKKTASASANGKSSNKADSSNTKDARSNTKSNVTEKTSKDEVQQGTRAENSSSNRRTQPARDAPSTNNRNRSDAAGDSRGKNRVIFSSSGPSRIDDKTFQSVVPVPSQLKQFCRSSDGKQIMAQVLDTYKVTSITYKPEDAEIEIMGPTYDSVKMAETLMSVHIEKQSKLSATSRESSQLEESLALVESEYARGLRVEFPVTSDVLGIIIGKTGQNINEVKQKTGVRIIAVASDENPPKVRIYGYSAEAVSNARKMLEYVTEYVPLDKDTKNLFDTTLREDIRAKSNVSRVTVSQSAKGLDLVITGLKQNVAVAKTLIDVEIDYYLKELHSHDRVHELKAKLEDIQISYGRRRPDFNRDEEKKPGQSTLHNGRERPERSENNSNANGARSNPRSGKETQNESKTERAPKSDNAQIRAQSKVDNAGEKKEKTNNNAKNAETTAPALTRERSEKKSKQTPK